MRSAASELGSVDVYPTAEGGDGEEPFSGEQRGESAELRPLLSNPGAIHPEERPKRGVRNLLMKFALRQA